MFDPLAIWSIIGLSSSGQIHLPSFLSIVRPLPNTAFTLGFPFSSPKNLIDLSWSMSWLPFSEATWDVKRYSIAFVIELLPVPFSPRSIRDLVLSFRSSCLMPLKEFISNSLIFRSLIFRPPFD